MNVAQGLLTFAMVVFRAESRCSAKFSSQNCWIRSFPGIQVNIEASEKRGARLLKTYREESPLRCGHTCCLTASCHVAVFHSDATCCHVHCPTLESCIIKHNPDAVLLNISNSGLDPKPNPDLLVFGKNSDVRVGRINSSEPLPLDKRQFYHLAPPIVSIKPTTTDKSSTTAPKPPSITPFRTSPHALSTSINQNRAQTPPTFQLPNTENPKTDTQMYRSPKSWHEDPLTNNPSTVKELNPNHLTTLTSINEQQDIERSTRPSLDSPPTWFLKRITHKPLVKDTENPKTQMSVKARCSTPGREDQLADLGIGFQGPPVVLLACFVVFVACIIWILACWRTKNRRMEYYRASGGRMAKMRLVKYHLVAEENFR
ncbi:uncharacterized protein mansc4 isoform X2 [Stigmatopora nigra]